MIEPETSMEEIKHHESNKKISKDIKRDVIGTIFPQQRKLMGSSAQNSSGVHWCRRWVRFDEVRNKVAKVPGQVLQGYREDSGEGSRKGSGEGRGGFGAEPVQQGSGVSKVPEVSGEGLGSFGAEPIKVHQSSGEGSGRLWCGARSNSTLVRFNRVPV